MKTWIRFYNWLKEFRKEIWGNNTRTKKVKKTRKNNKPNRPNKPNKSIIQSIKDIYDDHLGIGS